MKAAGLCAALGGLAANFVVRRARSLQFG